jgi:hypothetical protein
VAGMPAAGLLCRRKPLKDYSAEKAASDPFDRLRA